VKRLLALLAFLACSSLPSFATWSQVGSPQAFYCGDGGSGAPISACTQTIAAPVAGHLLVVNALYNDSTSAMTISSVCSGASCTGTTGGWVHPASCHGYETGFQAMDWAYTLSATTATSLTVNFSGSGGQYIGIVVFEYAGTGPFVFDSCVTKIDPAQTTTPVAGSITTTGANDLAIAGVYADITFPGSPAVSPSPWTTPAIFASDSAYSHALNISPRTLQAIFTHTNAVYAPGGTIAFKDSVAISTGKRKHVIAFWRTVTDGLAAAVSSTVDYMKILAASTFSSVNLSSSGQSYNGTFDQPNEALPHGWPPSWGATSAFGDMNNTINSTYGQEKALEPWGVTYVTQSVLNGKSPASNTRVAIKDCTVATKSSPSSSWQVRHLLASEFDNAWYAEDFTKFTTIAGDMRIESDGSFSVTAGNVENRADSSMGRVAHWNAPFPRICMTQQTNSNGTCTTPPATYGGLVFACKVRLILDNPAGVDDRYLAKYVTQVGADPYADNQSAGIENNPAIGSGKEIVVTPDWRLVAFSTLTEAQLKAFADPVPIDITGVAADATVNPKTTDFGDAQAIALGMRFKSDTAGYIKAIRFYKAAANTGTHIGSLWSDSGTLLSQVTFTGESASGWQEMALATPIAISANTSYRVSYWAPNGHYSSDVNYFTSADQEKWPLHAMRSIGTGGQYNGWFALTNVFPATFVSNGANFYVDVVFVKTTSDTVTYSLFK
jgi:hypothetical protein